MAWHGTTLGPMYRHGTSLQNGWGFSGAHYWSPRANPNPDFPHSRRSMHGWSCRGDVASPEIGVEGMLAKLAAIFPASRFAAVAVIVLCCVGRGGVDERRAHSHCMFESVWGSRFRISVEVDGVWDFVVVNVCTSRHPSFRGVGRIQ